MLNLIEAWIAECERELGLLENNSNIHQKTIVYEADLFLPRLKQILAKKNVYKLQPIYTLIRIRSDIMFMNYDEYRRHSNPLNNLCIKIIHVMSRFIMINPLNAFFPHKNDQIYQIDLNKLQNNIKKNIVFNNEIITIKELLNRYKDNPQNYFEPLILMENRENQLINYGLSTKLFIRNLREKWYELLWKSSLEENIRVFLDFIDRKSLISTDNEPLEFNYYIRYFQHYCHEIKQSYKEKTPTIVKHLMPLIIHFFPLDEHFPQDEEITIPLQPFTEDEVDYVYHKCKETLLNRIKVEKSNKDLTTIFLKKNNTNNNPVDLKLSDLIEQISAEFDSTPSEINEERHRINLIRYIKKEKLSLQGDRFKEKLDFLIKGYNDIYCLLKHANHPDRLILLKKIANKISLIPFKFNDFKKLVINLSNVEQRAFLENHDRALIKIIWAHLEEITWPKKTYEAFISLFTDEAAEFLQNEIAATYAREICSLHHIFQKYDGLECFIDLILDKAIKLHPKSFSDLSNLCITIRLNNGSLEFGKSLLRVVSVIPHWLGNYEAMTKFFGCFSEEFIKETICSILIESKNINPSQLVYLTGICPLNGALYSTIYKHLLDVKSFSQFLDFFKSYDNYFHCYILRFGPDIRDKIKDNCWNKWFHYTKKLSIYTIVRILFHLESIIPHWDDFSEKERALIDQLLQMIMPQENTDDYSKASIFLHEFTSLLRQNSTSWRPDFFTANNQCNDISKMAQEIFDLRAKYKKQQCQMRYY